MAKMCTFASALNVSRKSGVALVLGVACSIPVMPAVALPNMPVHVPVSPPAGSAFQNHFNSGGHNFGSPVHSFNINPGPHPSNSSSLHNAITATIGAGGAGANAGSTGAGGNGGTITFKPGTLGTTMITGGTPAVSAAGGNGGNKAATGTGTPTGGKGGNSGKVTPNPVGGVTPNTAAGNNG